MNRPRHVSMILSKAAMLWALIVAAPPISTAKDVQEFDFLALDEPSEQWSEDECWSHLAAAAPGGAAAPATRLNEEVMAYQSLVERSLSYRDATVEVVAALLEKIEADQALSGADLRSLREGTMAHLDLRDELYTVAERYECLVAAPATLVHASGISREVQVQAVMLSLSAALVLYDNYLLAIGVVEEDPKLRRLLNDEDAGYGLTSGRLAEVTRSYNSVGNRVRVRAAIRFYEENYPMFAGKAAADPGMQYLNLLIRQSPAYDLTREFSPLFVLERKFGFYGAITRDVLNSLQVEGINLFSMVFGNSVGLVESRNGKLYGREDVSASVQARLRPGDILLEKTPFRLTDKFIPGHWGHAAVWVGSEADLRFLGLWDHPLVVPHHRDLREGRSVVEALRRGVRLSSLDHFLNIDDIGVLRDTALDADGRREVVLMALRQVGKAYDFNFDVETTDRIVCSELVYLVHTRIPWPTSKTLGRVTISPDNVALRALDGGPLDLVAFYHDGEPVMTDPLGRMAQLMGQP